MSNASTNVSTHDVIAKVIQHYVDGAGAVADGGMIQV